MERRDLFLPGRLDGGRSLDDDRWRRGILRRLRRHGDGGRIHPGLHVAHASRGSCVIAHIACPRDELYRRSGPRRRRHHPGELRRSTGGGQQDSEDEERGRNAHDGNLSWEFSTPGKGIYCTSKVLEVLEVRLPSPLSTSSTSSTSTTWASQATPLQSPHPCGRSSAAPRCRRASCGPRCPW